MSSVFSVGVILQTGADLSEVERIIAEEIDRIVREPISQRELDRVVVDREARLVWGLENFMARANALQAYNHYLGDPDGFTMDLDRYRNLTPASIQQVAGNHLGNDRRIEMVVTPTAQGGAP
jgi:predicted Zn-dependent peptidase